MASIRETVLLLLAAGIMPIGLFSEGAYCPQDLPTALFEQGYSALREILDDPYLQGNQTYTVREDKVFWQKYCGYWHWTQQSLQSIFEGCSGDYIVRIFNGAMLYHSELIHIHGTFIGGLNDVTTPGKMCSGGEINVDINTLLEKSSTATCRRNIKLHQLTQCYSAFENEVKESQSLWVGDNAIASPEKVTDAIKMWVADTLRCILDILSSSCIKEDRSFVVFLANLTFPPTVQVSPEYIGMRASLKELFVSNRTTVAVYGDPHVIVFRLSRRQTCASEGTRVYLKNRFYSVSGTNTRVATGLATAVTQVAVIFTKKDGSTLGMYEARGAELPASFSSGDVRLMEGEALVDITGSSARGKDRVVISDMRSGTIFYLSMWSTYYSITVRAADVLFRQSYGLLVTGCVTKDEIDIRAYLPVAFQRLKRGTLSTTCEEACGEVTSLERFDFRLTCLFDCITMENSNAIQMTVDVQTDMDAIVEKDSMVSSLANNTAPHTDATAGQANGAISWKINEQLTGPLLIGFLSITRSLWN